MNWIRSLILLGLFTGLASAQEQRFRPQGTALQSGTPIEREMAVGQVHSFIVTSPEDSFVQIAVEQRGIDVVVSVFSPAGKKLGEYDSPTGTEGTENVSFTAIEKGTYRIQVTPLERDQDTPAGRFQIKIVELRAATEEELAAGKNLDALKIRAVALLGEVELLMTEVRVPQTRIMAQLQAAQMLWEVDEKRAIKYTNDAMTGVRELYASIDPNSKEYFKNYHGIAYLRSAIIQTVLQRQPELALSFLRSTPPLTDPFGNQPDPFSQDGSLEADIANQILKTDPKRTLELARETLKTRLSANVSTVLSNLKPKYPELAAELANEIATRLLSEKLLTNNQASSLLIDLLHIAESPRRNQTAETNGSSRPRLLSEQQYRDLLQKALSEALAYKPPPPNTYSPERDQAWNLLQSLKGMTAELDAVMSGGAAAVEKKINELTVANNSPQMQELNKFHTAINDSNIPLDDTLASLSKAPKEHREQLYVQLASRAAMNGDTAKARQIIQDHVKNPYQRQQALQHIEYQETQRALQKGKIEDALRRLAEIPDAEERAQRLGEITNQIGPGQKRATALNLLDQARGLLPPSPQARSQVQMNTLLDIARAFSRYDSKRAFEIVDPLVDQLNEMTIAARTLEGFGSEYYDQDELNMNNGNAVGASAMQLSNALGTLALSNFDRAKATADRLRLPEVRLRAYLNIAQQSLNPNR